MKMGYQITAVLTVVIFGYFFAKFIYVSTVHILGPTHNNGKPKT